MPTASFSKDIANIFNSHEIPEDLKYDIACRLICEDLGVCHASFILYAAREDKLICRGSHLSPEQKSRFSISDPVLKKIINQITVFEFFASLPPDQLQTASYAEFKESAICGNTFANKTVDAKQFEVCKMEWQAPSFQQVYYDYKTALHKENFEIEDTSISGKFFQELLENKNKLTNKIELLALKNGPQRGQQLLHLWQYLQIEAPVEALYYVGLPLFATERYIGILRLLVCTGHENEIERYVRLPTDASLKHIPERLSNFAQLISLHLKAHYYLAAYRALGNLNLHNSHNFRIDSQKLKKVCNIFSQVINCHGCIIRFSEQKDTDNPPIRATSDSLDEYKDFIRRHTDFTFSKEIFTIFSAENPLGKKVRAINFSVTDIDSNTFQTKEYYYDEHNNLKSIIHDERFFSHFTREYNNKLFTFKMREILFLPIDDVQDGIIVLTNTHNRQFTPSDIDMILLASKGIQLEFKTIQELETRTQKELREAQITGMHVVLHQFGQVIKSSFDTIEEIYDRNQHFIRKVFQEEKNIPEDYTIILNNLKLLRFLIMHSQAQLRRAERIKKINDEPIRTHLSTISDFNSFLGKKCRDFRPYARVERGVNIWLHNSPEKITLDTDEELLTEVLFSLLDNAVKYSFHAEEMKPKGIPLDETRNSSDGNIQLSLIPHLSHIEIRISNWGPPLPMYEREIIFERSVRGSNSKNVVGTGLGLYLCRKIVTALHGQISVETNKYKTTFIILLKR